MKTILVTGAAGFIGSNLVHHCLAAETDLRLVGLDALTYAGNLENLAGADPARFTFVKGDIDDADLLAGLFAEHRLAAVVHLAAESHVDRSIHAAGAFLRTNVLGTQVLLDAARSAWRQAAGFRPGVLFVHVSTDEVYGALGSTGRFDEDSPLAPNNPYSASKAAADHLVAAAHHTHGLPACTTRCTNNYGPYQFPEKLIPLMIRNALSHQPLPVYGDGGQVRDWIHVTDHCRALTRVLRSGTPGRVYNISAESERENIHLVRRLVDLLRERTGDTAIDAALIRHVTDRPGHDRRYALDPGRIRTELGWAPRVSFDQGLADTVDWYLDHRDWTERVASGEYRRFYQLNYANRAANGTLA